MKRIIAIIVLSFVLCGCERTYEVKNERFNDGDFYVYCDEEYGVEYIHYINGYRGGITIRLDENGDIIHCEKKDSDINE